MRVAFVIFIIFVSIQLRANEYAPKLLLRTGLGATENVGSVKGQASSFGGFNLTGLYYLTGELAAGIGYYADFDMAQNRIPVSGLDFTGRYYWKGPGTRRSRSGDWGASEIQTQLSSYLGASYSQRSYYLGKDSLSSDATKYLEGNYSTINLLIGADYRLDRQFEFNAEISYGVMSFSASDERVRLLQKMLYVGLSYVF